MGRSHKVTDSDWRGGFLFLGTQLALDLLNTRPVQDGEPMELLTDFGALLRWFHAAELLSARDEVRLLRRWGRSSRAQRAVEAVRQLRESLRKEVLAWEGGSSVRRSTVTGLNRWMADHPILSRLRVTGNTSSITHWFQTRNPEDLFAPLALSAATLFASVDRSRVRKCAQCVLHFHDTSKKGTRRWCSMRLCGNRAKVATYAARKRARRA